MSEASNPETTATTEPTTESSAPVEDTAPQAPSDPELKITTSALKDRLERSYASRLSQRFGKTEEELRAILKANEEAEAAREEQRRAEQTEIERLREQFNEAESRAKAAQEAADRAAVRDYVAQQCIALGIKDLDYAIYQVERRAASLGDDDEPLDAAEFLKAEVEARPQAYGVRSASAGSTTSVYGADGNRPPSPDERKPPAAPDAMTMTDEELRKYRNERHGLSH